MFKNMQNDMHVHNVLKNVFKMHGHVKHQSLSLGREGGKTVGDGKVVPSGCQL